VITALDTSVLLDVFGADSEYGPRSAAAMRRCLAEGSLRACEVVWAETAASFGDTAAAEAALKSLHIDFSPLDASTSLAVGGAWRAHRRAGGSRERVIADFLIGAHAVVHADRLLTRDRGFYREYFSALRVMDPTDASDDVQREPATGGRGNAPQILGIAGDDDISTSERAHNHHGIDEIVLSAGPERFSS
jgi:predicted nucleic acid-binding protein